IAIATRTSSRPATCTSAEARLGAIRSSSASTVTAMKYATGSSARFSQRSMSSRFGGRTLCASARRGAVTGTASSANWRKRRLREVSAPKLLFLKLHSTGLYRETLSQWDEGQPVPVEIAHMLCDEQGNAINVNCNIVKSEGRIPQEGAIAVHGITNQMAAQWGLPEPRLIGLLADALKTLPYKHMKVVSYHEFDHRIVSASLSRMGRSMAPQRDFSRLWELRPQTEFIFLQEPWAT